VAIAPPGGLDVLSYDRRKLDGESAIAGSTERSEERRCELGGLRHSVFFADQCEAGIPRFADE
jgi:hypothetical protein